jgi:hypothetical protein
LQLIFTMKNRGIQNALDFSDFHFSNPSNVIV